MGGNSTNEIQPKVLTVANLISNSKLRIPDYQRPYKWKVKNVNQFINDLINHADQGQYRIGNMVVHINENQEHDIVDGQQRFITLLLILKSIRTYNDSSLNNIWSNVKEYLNGNNLQFSNPITRFNLFNNYQVIKQHSADLYRIRNFIIHYVEIVQFTLTNQSEAFQFFDSQNARGRELYPHDLLKHII